MTLNGITLTWATPVDAAELGARMESYVETKASIHVFKLCAQHAHPGASLGKFPPELIEMVSNEVQNAAFNRRLQIWQDSTRCCANKCRPSVHLSKEDYESLIEEHVVEDHDCEIMDGESVCNEHLRSFEEYLDETGVGHEEHTDAVEGFLAQLESNNPYTKSGRWFKKCKKVCSFFLDQTTETKQWHRLLPKTSGWKRILQSSGTTISQETCVPPLRPF